MADANQMAFRIHVQLQIPGVKDCLELAQQIELAWQGYTIRLSSWHLMLLAPPLFKERTF